MRNILSYFGLVGFLVWFIQTQKLFDRIRVPFFQEIRECQICLGTWVAMLLYPSYKTKIINHPLDIFFTSSIISFIVYVFKSGWQRLFSTTVIK